MEANRSDAEECLAIAKQYLAKGNKVKAVKLLEKSSRLYPTQECRALLERLRNSPQESTESTESTENVSNARHRRNVENETKTEEKNYTEDDAALVKKILSRKNYYEVLEVSKDASDAELKKNYRKLALRLHPDKNQAPKASDAFKAVGKAYAVLSDPAKRRNYDSFGDEDLNSNVTRRGGRMYRDDDVDVDELFRMFFGGSPFGRDLYATRRYRHNHQHYHHHDIDDQRNEQEAALRQLLFILGLLLLLLVSSALVVWNDSSSFSLRRTRWFKYERWTKSLPTPIKFYVDADFDAKYGKSLEKIEKEVRWEYLSYLEDRCFTEQQQRNRDLRVARFYRDEEREREATGRTLRNCDQYVKIRDGG
ncbi:dnaJ homolog subfamily B member 14-like [Oscarella lobularis]|uniref:dnaJ homolog subfamily B member 14-like n=1 Tax=Oscarella lobularis TaxID=121494 RepID=UPI00331340DD